MEADVDRLTSSVPRSNSIHGPGKHSACEESLGKDIEEKPTFHRNARVDADLRLGSQMVADTDGFQSSQPNGIHEPKTGTRVGDDLLDLPPLTVLERLVRFFLRVGWFSRRVETQRRTWPRPARLADRVIYFLFMFSATVFLIEQVQRRMPNAPEPGRFQDMLFMGSFLGCIALIVPVCFSIFFGFGEEAQKESKHKAAGKPSDD